MSDAAQRVLAKPNPYDAVVRGLWQMLEANADFCALVQPGNRIKFLGEEGRDPIKVEVGSADFPEVRIVETTNTPHPHKTSSAHRDTVSYEIQVSTGDQRLDEYHNALRWIVFQVMANMEKWLRKHVTFDGANIVQEARPVSCRSGYAEVDLNRGVKGWAAIWSVEIGIWWQASTIT